jgi:hypothetical protein
MPQQDQYTCKVVRNGESGVMKDATSCSSGGVKVVKGK